VNGRLQGKVAIVTGGSRQIGLAIARRFASEGARVVVAARGSDDGLEAERGIRADGGEATAMVCDVADETSVAATVDRTVELYGGLDIMVNNAGTGVAEEITDLSWEDYRRVMDINVGGVLLGTKYGARAIRQTRRGGSIINISSIQGVLPLRQSAVYAGSKGAVNLITQQTAADLGQLRHPRQRHRTRVHRQPHDARVPRPGEHLARRGHRRRQALDRPGQARNH